MKNIVFSANTAWFVYNFYSGLMKELMSSGFTVHVIAPKDEAVEPLIGIGVKYHDLFMINDGTNPFSDIKTFINYLKLYQGIRPLWALHFTIKPNMYGTLAASLCGVKSINTVTGLGTAFIAETVVSKVVRLMYKAIQPLAQQVFVLNGDDYKLLVEMKMCSPKKMKHIPGSGLDISRFTPIRSEPNELFTFLYIGRILRDKGIIELIEALRILKSKGNSVKCLFVGYVGVANKTAITLDEVKFWEAEGLIEFKGSTIDVRPAIASSDCVVLPSYREGLPQSLMEASAMGKPIIATDVPGCRDVVVDGITGFLCKVKDSNSLADTMHKLHLMDIGARQSLGEAGRTYIKETFTTDIVYKEYLNIIIH